MPKPPAQPAVVWDPGFYVTTTTGGGSYHVTVSGYIPDSPQQEYDHAYIPWGSRVPRKETKEFMVKHGFEV
jgi:hypothetical protein